MVKRPVCGKFASANQIAKYDLLVMERDALEKSNRLMDEELGRLRRQIDVFGNKYEELSNENQRLKGRGFWARLFNL